MANNRTRYRQMERYMTYALIADAALFILYLLVAALGVIWLKIVISVLTILLSALCLAYLFISHELLRRRSLWMTAAAAGIIACTIMSLLLNYPAAKPDTIDSTTTTGDTAAYYSPVDQL